MARYDGVNAHEIRTWQADPAADRKAFEDICDILHVWCNSNANTAQDMLTHANIALEDIIATLHTSGNADFGSTGDAAVTLRDARK